MNGNDRPAFESQVSILCAAYNVPATPERIEGFWASFGGKVSLAAFAKVVAHALGEDGTEKMPTVHQLWTIYRKNKPTLQGAAQPVKVQSEFDNYHAYGNRTLFGFLMAKQGVDAVILPQLIDAKNRIMGQYREVEREEAVESEEIRKQLYRTWETIFAAQHQDMDQAARSPPVSRRVVG